MCRILKYGKTLNKINITVQKEITVSRRCGTEADQRARRVEESRTKYFYDFYSIFQDYQTHQNMTDDLDIPWRTISWSMEQETDPLNLNIYLAPLLVRVSHPLVRRKEELLQYRHIRAVRSEQMCSHPAHFLCSVTDKKVYFGPHYNFFLLNSYLEFSVPVSVPPTGTHSKYFLPFCWQGRNSVHILG